MVAVAKFAAVVLALIGPPWDRGSLSYELVVWQTLAADGRGGYVGGGVKRISGRVFVAPRVCKAQIDVNERLTLHFKDGRWLGLPSDGCT
jgi:hypothetical protein